MLFHSYGFIFVFLPVTLGIFAILARYTKLTIVCVWLVITSIVFYSWWNPIYALLIIGSMLINYILGSLLHSNKLTKHRQQFLIIGIVFNLSLIGYFKYTNFFVDTINTVFNSNISIAPIALPLAISFFTFQQIAYLVGTYRRDIQETNISHYALFVTFFPQLIAGPIVHHQEMLPQFANPRTFRFKVEHLSIGITIFVLGLSKKVLLADSVAPYANAVFNAANDGTVITLIDSWIGSLAYTFQIYFDFSGYSDMAIGLARMFGIILPLNFHSPYKATSIIEFWRRWHMTLSRFLLHYLYIPLGGNRKGQTRRSINLMITMLLGGLWHGAGWTFIIWGGLHGVYLIINHGWNSFSRKYFPSIENVRIIQPIMLGITFTATVFAWVFFRAESLHVALNIVSGMLGFHSIGSFSVLNDLSPTIYNEIMLWGVFLGIITWFLPNTQQLMVKHNPVLPTYDKTPISSEKNIDTNKLPFSEDYAVNIQWQPNRIWAIIIAIFALASLIGMSSTTEFLYFNF